MLIRRILNFKKDDWNHLGFLVSSMIKDFILGNFAESKDSYYWIKIHLNYDSNKIN